VVAINLASHTQLKMNSNCVQWVARIAHRAPSLSCQRQTNFEKKVRKTKVKTSHIRVGKVYLQNRHAYGLGRWHSYREVAIKALCS